MKMVIHLLVGVQNVVLSMHVVQYSEPKESGQRSIEEKIHTLHFTLRRNWWSELSRVSYNQSVTLTGSLCSYVISKDWFFQEKLGGFWPFQDKSWAYRLKNKRKDSLFRLSNSSVRELDDSSCTIIFLLVCFIGNCLAHHSLYVIISVRILFIFII